VALLALLAGVPVAAQERVAVPLPVEGGVFYYRTGPIRAAPAPAPGVSALVAEALAEAGLQGETPRSLARPATRLDLLTMEQRLRQAFDTRIARALALQGGGLRTPGLGGGGRPVIVLPGQALFAPSPLAPPPVVEAPPTPPPPSLGVTPPVVALAPLPRLALPEPRVSVREVERALLDLGLFRALGVNFEFDRAALLSSALPTLDAVGEALVRHPALRVEVHGHTDSVGRADYNLRLSERRAEAVRQYLLEAFPTLAPERLSVRGFGQERPVATNANPTGRTLNRRVEFVVLNPQDARAAEPEPSEEEESLQDRLRRIIEEEVSQAREEG
jgi:outer membrane protein OmpA-like peptidoglycan-associated protein